MFKKILSLVILFTVTQLGHSETLPNTLEEQKSIQWDNLAKSTNLPSDKNKAYFTFKGTNNSNEEVTITKIEKSCGCTETSIDTNTIKPNEFFTIKAKIELDEKGGASHKFLSIYYKNGAPQKLGMEIIRPNNFTLNPDELIWYSTEEEQTSTLTILNKNLHFINAIGLDDNFKISFKKITDGKYLISVKPITKETLNSAAKIEMKTGEKTIHGYVKLIREETQQGSEPIAIDAPTTNTPTTVTPTVTPTNTTVTGQNNTNQPEESKGKIAEELRNLYKKEKELLQKLKE